MEILLVLLLLAVFAGPSAYRLYERFQNKRRGKAAPEEPRQGPSYGRHMLGMLVPVFLLIVFLALLWVGVRLFLGHLPAAGGSSTSFIVPLGPRPA